MNNILMGPSLANFINTNAQWMASQMVTLDDGLRIQKNLVTRQDANFLDHELLGDYRFCVLEKGAGEYRKPVALGKNRHVLQKEGFGEPVELPRLVRMTWDSPMDPFTAPWAGALLFAQLHGALLPTVDQFDRAMLQFDPRVILKDWEPGTHGPTSFPIDDPKCRRFPNGVSDMTGNAWQWMMDRIGEDGRMVRSGPLRANPTVVFRHFFPFNSQLPFVGFRCVMPKVDSTTI